MSYKRTFFSWREMSVAIALAAGVFSCAVPPAGTGDMDRPAELPSEAREFGALPISITDQLTDGRHVKLRGKIRNPYNEAIEGVRLVYLDIAPGEVGRVLNHALRIMDVEVASGGETFLRWDIQTMYAGSPGARFSLMAFAIKRGGQELPPPPGWEPGDDDTARGSR